MLRELQSVGSQTLLLVTHDPQIAALADRHIQLEQLSHGGQPVAAKQSLIDNEIAQTDIVALGRTDIDSETA